MPTLADSRVPTWGQGVPVSSASESLMDTASAIASRFGLPIVPSSDAIAWLAKRPQSHKAPHSSAQAGLRTPQSVPPFLLFLTNERLELRATGKVVPGPVYAEFVSGPLAWRRETSGKNQHLCRSVGLSKRSLSQPSLRVLDTTAGLGRDAFVLACQGACVTMCERNPVAAALLADGLHRASQHVMTAGDKELAAVLGRMTFEFCDTCSMLQSDKGKGAERWDVVYLDPMYPHRDTSALSKKEMRAFREVVGADGDAAQLLALALGIAKERVVVKRPKGAAPLGVDSGVAKPDFEIASPNTRYDVYQVKK